MRRAFVIGMIAGCGFEITPAGTGDASPDSRGDSATLIDAPVGTTDVSTPPPCPADYATKYDGHSYRRTAVETDRSSAKLDCGSIGHLVKIETAAEDAFAQTLATGGYLWFGLVVVAGQYQWDDGTPLGTYENFEGTGIPSPGGNTCVDKNLSSGEWEPYSCTVAHYGVCECDGS